MSSAKQTPATIWHGDGREKALQTHILALPRLRNNPTAIIHEIDTWAAKNNHCMMTIGPDRSKVITEIIRSTRPRTMAELGGYVGYSAILFGHEVRKAGGERYDSFEYNAEYAAIARSLVRFAGLGEFVEIRVGSCSDTLEEFAAQERGKGQKEDARFNVLFVDHAEELYLSDLRICEKLGLVRRGSVVVADNVGGVRGSVRARGYVKWVEEGDKYETKRIPCVLPNGEEDAILVSTMMLSDVLEGYLKELEASI
ncbi:S-adenosyl-L-methionine-dependent methyltransferase [Aspergillus keveii]|uniref:catechol O-methyltransferase n=1 Tax=Aspergillus keveii TaxID=714993 RepID=A0ABR4FZR6_9EURO